MQKRMRVFVTGLGAVTPVGHTVPATWQALLEGRSGISAISTFDVSCTASKIAGTVCDFDAQAIFGRKEAHRMSRFAQLALVAAQEAVADAGLNFSNEKTEQCGVILGCSIGGIDDFEESTKLLTQGKARVISPFLIVKMTPNMAAFHISKQYGLTGHNYTVSTGCASGTHAIGEATEVIRSGRADVMITGGTEAVICETVMAAFSNMKALSLRNDSPTRASRPFDRERDGFVLSEGAGILILESERHAIARNARVYGEILGYGSSADAHHVIAPHPDGAVAARAMRVALGDAHVAVSEIDYVNTHGTGTELGDVAETEALKLVLGDHAYEIPMNSTKSMVGHSLGAAGAIEAIVVFKEMESGLLHPTTNLETPDPLCDLDYIPGQARQHPVQVAMSTSIGLGGQNAVIVVRKGVAS